MTQSTENARHEVAGGRAITEADIPLRIAEMIDHLIQTEVRNLRYFSIPTRDLYAAARAEHAARTGNDVPLTYAAARRLVEDVAADDIVLIITGWVVPPFMPRSEADGPVAAVGLARSLSKALGARVVLVTDDPVLPVLERGCRAIGLNPISLDLLLQFPESGRLASAVSVVGFPMTDGPALEKATEMFSTLNPKAIVTIERPGPNPAGVYHSGRGYDMSMNSAKTHHLVEMAREQGVLTIGCLDIGNEIGGGNIQETVRELFPLAKKCKCPCGAGTACITKVDLCIPASNSAWGANGIAAVLAGMVENIDVAQGSNIEFALLTEMTKAGMCDAGTLAPTLTLSSAPLEYYGHLLDLMKGIVNLSLLDLPNPKPLRERGERFATGLPLEI